MIDVKTKCVIKKAPATFAELEGKQCQATEKEGARNTGAQGFLLDAGGMFYGNADSGFVVEPKV